MLISVVGAEVRLGGRTILTDVSLTISRGDRWGIVGRNGSGKTTLLRLLTGEVEAAAGAVTRAGGVRMTVLDQHRTFEGAHTVWEAVALAFRDLRALEASLETQVSALASAPTDAALSRYDRDLERFQRQGGYEYRSRVDAVLEGLGFNAAAASTQPLTHLSGGELGRVGLARQLVSPADVLLLDEPTNHLDIDTTRWLERYLREFDGTIVMISHDRLFLDAVTDHIVHIEAGTAVTYQGGYSRFAEQHAAREQAQQRAYELQQKVIASEEDFIRRNIAGNNTKQAQGRRTRLARLPRLSPPPGSSRAMGLRLEPAARGGNQVLTADHVTVSVQDRVLIRDFTARIDRGDVIGLIGANGAGKSTLLRAIAGDHPLAGGTLRLGESIEIAYYRQDMAQIPNGVTLFNIIHNLRPMWERGQVQSHLGRFGFSGDAVLRTADTLSGGERARVALAMLMLTHANFLMFDEPTNHLDVESIEVLEDALDSFDGTVLLVSHDRALLDALTTRIWSLENGRISDFDGPYAEWQADRDDAAARALRESEASAAAVRERERAVARKREASERGARAGMRELRNAAALAEQNVEKMEARAAALREQLADADLYISPDGAKRAVALNAELTAVLRELDAAVDAWTIATEALEAAQ